MRAQRSIVLLFYLILASGIIISQQGTEEPTPPATPPSRDPFAFPEKPVEPGPKPPEKPIEIPATLQKLKEIAQQIQSDKQKEEITQFVEGYYRQRIPLVDPRLIKEIESLRKNVEETIKQDICLIKIEQLKSQVQLAYQNNDVYKIESTLLEIENLLQIEKEENKSFLSQLQEETKKILEDAKINAEFLAKDIKIKGTIKYERRTPLEIDISLDFAGARFSVKKTTFYTTYVSSVLISDKIYSVGDNIEKDTKIISIKTNKVIVEFKGRKFEIEF